MSDQNKGSSVIVLLAAAVAGLLFMVAVVVVLLSPPNECRPADTPGSGTPVPAGTHVKPTAPAATTMTSGFGERWGTQHQGNDYAGDVGTPIYAFTDGRVVAAGPATGFGNWIIVDHEIDGHTYSTVYGHMFDDGVLVRVGDHVTAGQKIALIGNNGQSTGAHLHFEIWDGGRLPDGAGTAFDPTQWVDEATDPGTAATPAPSPGTGGGQTDTPMGGLNTAQLAIAKQTVAIGEAMGVPEQGIVVALSTEGQESTYRMLASSNVPESHSYPNDGVGSDNQSVNQFQQQVGHWGTAEELMNPVTANVKFYNALLAIPDWESLPVTVAAQTVQDSAHPEAYADDEPLARQLYQQFNGAGDDLTAADRAAIASGNTNAVGVAAGGSTRSGCEDGTPTNPDGPQYVPGGPFGANVIAAASRWIGTPYSWGGGDTNGPTKGIRDGGVADSFGDFDKVGFDCSGLTLYAVYQASGGQITLPHFTGTPGNPGQLYDPRGQEIPIDQKLPGDLIYFGSGGATHHVGIYYGVQDGQEMLLNAPQSGDVVGIDPLSNWAGEEMYVRRFGSTPSPHEETP